VDLPTAERPTELRPVPMALDVRFEDEHLLVVNKPAPLASIPSSLVPGEPTLAAGLLYHLGEGSALHLVNRLDRGTTGLAAAAKTAYVHELLRRRLHTGAFHRTYLAVCEGRLRPPEGKIDLPLGPKPGSLIEQMVRPDGKSAVTRYKTLEAGEGFSLLKLELETGRTHQILVHLAHLGHPLLGDFLYGRECRTPGRPALHSAHLSLLHPLTGARLELDAPLPADLRALLTGSCLGETPPGA